MQVYFGEQGHEQVHFDQTGTILDSNSEEVWGETKMHPKAIWWRILICGEFTIASSNTKTTALQTRREPRTNSTHIWHQAGIEPRPNWLVVGSKNS